MSHADKNTVRGKIRYNGVNYKVSNAPLSDEILHKLEEYTGSIQWADPVNPWKIMPLLWVIEDNKLYLEKLYVDGLMEEILGSNKSFASWVDELKLLVDDKTICKTYEQKDSYLKEQTLLQLNFDKGVFLTEEKQTELYRSIESKNNIEKDLAYTTFRINSNDLLVYLEDGMSSVEDQLLAIFSDLIDDMLEENDDGISLDMSDLKEVLQKGDLALFASVKGKNITKMVSILVSSLTNEGLLDPKGCLLNLVVNKRYPRKSILSIIKDIDVGLKFNFEPLQEDMKDPFYVGTRFINAMDEDEVLIMILVSI